MQIAKPSPGAQRTAILALDFNKFHGGRNKSIFQTDYIPLPLDSHGPRKVLQDLEGDGKSYAGVKVPRILCDLSPCTDGGKRAQ